MEMEKIIKDTFEGIIKKDFKLMSILNVSQFGVSFDIINSNKPKFSFVCCLKFDKGELKTEEIPLENYFIRLDLKNSDKEILYFKFENAMIDMSYIDKQLPRYSYINLTDYFNIKGIFIDNTFMSRKMKSLKFYLEVLPSKRLLFFKEINKDVKIPVSYLIFKNGNGKGFHEMLKDFCIQLDKDLYAIKQPFIEMNGVGYEKEYKMKKEAELMRISNSIYGVAGSDLDGILDYKFVFDPVEKLKSIDSGLFNTNKSEYKNIEEAYLCEFLLWSNAVRMEAYMVDALGRRQRAKQYDFYPNITQTIGTNEIEMLGIDHCCVRKNKSYIYSHLKDVKFRFVYLDNICNGVFLTYKSLNRKGEFIRRGIGNSIENILKEIKISMPNRKKALKYRKYDKDIIRYVIPNIMNITKTKEIDSKMKSLIDNEYKIFNGSETKGGFEFGIAIRKNIRNAFGGFDFIYTVREPNKTPTLRKVPIKGYMIDIVVVESDRVLFDMNDVIVDLGDIFEDIPAGMYIKLTDYFDISGSIKTYGGVNMNRFETQMVPKNIEKTVKFPLEILYVRDQNLIDTVVEFSNCSIYERECDICDSLIDGRKYLLSHSNISADYDGDVVIKTYRSRKKSKNKKRNKSFNLNNNTPNGLIKGNEDIPPFKWGGIQKPIFIVTVDHLSFADGVIPIYTKEHINQQLKMLFDMITPKTLVSFQVLNLAELIGTNECFRRRDIYKIFGDFSHNIIMPAFLVRFYHLDRTKYESDENAHSDNYQDIIFILKQQDLIKGHPEEFNSVGFKLPDNLTYDLAKIFRFTMKKFRINDMTIYHDMKYSIDFKMDLFYKYDDGNKVLSTIQTARIDYLIEHLGQSYKRVGETRA